MKLRISNQMNMVGSCLNISQGDKHRAVWDGQSPAGFGNRVALLQTSFDALITVKAAQVEAASNGAADSKAVAESTLEDRAHVLARALVVHLKSTGDLTRLGEVDLARSDIVRLRENDLVAKAVSIRDLGLAVQTEPQASENGVTAERVSSLSSAIETFKTSMRTPRGQIVNRNTLLKELDTDMASLIALLRDLDDLILQFDQTPAGKSFIEAWHGARVIIDRVGEHTKQPTAPTPTPATA